MVVVSGCDGDCSGAVVMSCDDIHYVVNSGVVK